VLLGSRHQSLGELAVNALKRDGIDAYMVVMSVDNDESVREAARAIAEQFGRLDVLVNNAGVKLETAPSPPSQCALDTVRETFETNVFGPIRVTQALLPLLREAAAPRIVNISSGMGSITLATTDTLYMSKPFAELRRVEGGPQPAHRPVRQRTPTW